MTLKKIGVKILIAVVVLGALAAAGYFYWQYQKVTSNEADKELKKTVTQVSKFMVLPDEVPTLATVTDITKLSDQKFFKNAQNGDEVLIYQTAEKAILYRPKINKVVEVAAISSIGQTNNPSSANAELTQVSTEVVNSQIELALYNGTPTIGLTNEVEKTITGKFTDVEIKMKETAAKNDYQQTIVVDITGKYKQRVADLASFLEAKVVALPQGEVSPQTDILVILGKSSVQ